MKYFVLLAIAIGVIGLREVTAQKLVIIGSSTSTCAFGLTDQSTVM